MTGSRKSTHWRLLLTVRSGMSYQTSCDGDVRGKKEQHNGRDAAALHGNNSVCHTVPS